MKKVAIIGSTQYQSMMEKHAEFLRKEGKEVRLPVLDNLTDAVDYVELEICARNFDSVNWADEVHVFWDQRSLGTMFDLGMCFALRKKVVIVYLEPKTFSNLMKQMEKLEGDYRRWAERAKTGGCRSI